MICKNCGNETDSSGKFCQICGSPMNGEKDNATKEKNRKIIGIFSLVSALLAFLTSCFFGVSIIFAVISIVLAVLTKPKNGFAIAGLIISIIGIIISILITVFFIFWIKKGYDFQEQNNQYMEETESLMANDLAVNDELSELYFYGDACRIPYTNPWTEKSLSNGDGALIYGTENAFLTQLGFSMLSDTGKPFLTEEDRKVFYDDLYAFWEMQCGQENDFVLTGGSDGLLTLDDNLYMATYDYVLSKDSGSGKFIMLVDPEKNAALSFRTYAEESALEHDERCIELLKSIEIEQQEKIVVDNDMYEMMDNMSAWNMYSDLRTGDLAKETSLEGEWRILDHYFSFYVFKDGKYLNYKSKDNIEDNYIKGNYVVDYGKNGFIIAGLDENKVDEIINSSNGKISEENLCVVTSIIEEFVNDGVPQELEPNQSVTQVWIIVDHEDEGIEAQVFNANNNSFYYYVKTKDVSSIEDHNLLK